MKKIKLTNVSLEPIEIVFCRSYDPIEVRTGNRVFLQGGSSIEINEAIQYKELDQTRLRDLKVDIYE